MYCYSTLKTEAAVSSETLILIYQTTRCQIVEDLSMYIAAVRNEGFVGDTLFVSWFGQSSRLCVTLFKILSSYTR